MRKVDAVLDLVELGLATWRLAHMMVHEEGPRGMFIKIREKSGIQYDDETGNVISYNDYTPLMCVWCTSVYVAAIMSFVPRRIVQALAISGLAVLADKFSRCQPTTIINNGGGNGYSLN